MRTATLGLAAGFTAVLGVTLVIQLAHLRTAHKGHNAAGDVWSSTFVGREDRLRASERVHGAVQLAWGRAAGLVVMVVAGRVRTGNGFP